MNSLGKQILGSVGIVLLLATMAISASATTLTLNDSELGTQLAKVWGPATITSITDIGPGVQFDFTGLDTSNGTGVSYGSGFSGPYDFSGYSGYTLAIKNIGSSDVTVNLDMNTGWTDAPWGGAANDTFFQNDWTTISPGQTKKITLNFSNATALYDTY